MQEIAPGVFHWSAPHPDIGSRVHSHYFQRAGVVADPMVPEEDGLDAFAGWDLHRLVLTSGLHYRQTEDFRDAFGCDVLCPQDGMHRLAPDQPATPYVPGAELARDLKAIEIGVLCPDEMALHYARDRGFLLVADGVMRPGGDGPLSFMPDHLLGDEPEAVKEGLARRYAEVAEEIEFDTLLFAHGEPLVGGAREALRTFSNRA
jgi:hypothetical protein